MAGRFSMLIHKITPFVGYTQLLKRLDTQFNEPINQNSIKVPKVVKPKAYTLFLLLASSKTLGARLNPCLVDERVSKLFSHIFQSTKGLITQGRGALFYPPLFQTDSIQTFPPTILIYSRDKFFVILDIVHKYIFYCPIS